MDYERKYKEALEWMQSVYSSLHGATKEDAEHYFPELKESKDERIRKTIYGWIYTQPTRFFDNGFSKEEMLDWVEKQGKKKSADKPKFKVGDWIVFNGLTLYIKEVVKGYYITKGGIITNSYDWDIDNAARLWTIQDAKDGDVLTNGESIVIFKQIVEPKYRQYIEAYIGLDWGYNIQVTSESWSLGIDKTMPATKEQRELLFSKMKEAGYEWDSEKKELKKIEPKILGADDILPYLGNNQVQDILEDMGMLDDNGQCPHTAEEIFKAGMEHAFNLNCEDTSSVKLDADKVIAWLVANICDFEYYVKLFKKDFGL